MGLELLKLKNNWKWALISARLPKLWGENEGHV